MRMDTAPPVLRQGSTESSGVGVGVGVRGFDVYVGVPVVLPTQRVPSKHRSTPH